MVNTNKPHVVHARVREKGHSPISVMYDRVGQLRGLGKSPQNGQKLRFNARSIIVRYLLLS